MSRIPIHFDKSTNDYFIWISKFGVKVMKRFADATEAEKFIEENPEKCFETSKKYLVRVCLKCNFTNVQGAALCANCGEDISKVVVTSVETKPSINPANNEKTSGGIYSSSKNANGQYQDRSDERLGSINALRFFAWLDLVAGLVGAFIIWLNFGSVETPIYGTITNAQINPIGIGIGIAVLLQGIFICAFFLVVAGAAEDIALIRRDSNGSGSV